MSKRWVPCKELIKPGEKNSPRHLELRVCQRDGKTLMSIEGDYDAVELTQEPDLNGLEILTLKATKSHP